MRFFATLESDEAKVPVSSGRVESLPGDTARSSSSALHAFCLLSLSSGGIFHEYCTLDERGGATVVSSKSISSGICAETGADELCA